MAACETPHQHRRPRPPGSFGLLSSCTWPDAEPDAGRRCGRLSGASSTIYLLPKPAGSVASSAGDSTATRSYVRHWTPVHLDFVVDDLAAAAERALRAGVKQESECVEWRGSRCITFSDPFGHGFCLIEFDEETYED